MDPHQTATSYSVTCETHDEAVFHCLTALAHFAVRAGEPDSPADSAVDTDPEGIAPGGWGRDDGRVTYHFADQRRRGIFLGEATRLLSGKWLRVELSS